MTGQRRVSDSELDRQLLTALGYVSLTHGTGSIALFWSLHDGDVVGGEVESLS